MKRVGLVSGALAGILVLAILGGCNGNPEESSSSPADGKTLVVAVVEAVGTGAIGEFASTTKVGDVTQNRNQLIKFTHYASDDRLDGTGEMTANNDQRDDGSSTGWGTFKFTNDGGTWEGDWTGAGEAKVDGNVYILTKLTGTGDYEGLTAYLVYVQPSLSLGFGAGESACTGYIEEID